MKFAEEFKFKVWGFSTSRLVLVLDALVFLYLVAAFVFLTDKSLPDPDHDRMRAHLEIASWLVFLALIFCFLPPFNGRKLYVCWPLTALAMFTVMLLAPL